MARRQDQVVRFIGYVAALIIFVANFLRSFSAMAEFAVEVGVARPGWDAWLVPIGVDVAIVAGTVMAGTGTGGKGRNWWAWSLFVFAAGCSIALNWGHAPHDNLWAQFIAVLPPLLMLWIAEVVLYTRATTTGKGGGGWFSDWAKDMLTSRRTTTTHAPASSSTTGDHRRWEATTQAATTNGDHPAVPEKSTPGGQTTNGGYPPEGRRRRALELWNTPGTTWRNVKQVAEAVGASRATVRGWRDKDGWPQGDHLPTDHSEGDHQEDLPPADHLTTDHRS